MFKRYTISSAKTTSLSLYKLPKQTNLSPFCKRYNSFHLPVLNPINNYHHQHQPQHQHHDDDDNSCLSNCESIETVYKDYNDQMCDEKIPTTLNSRFTQKLYQSNEKAKCSYYHSADEYKILIKKLPHFQDIQSQDFPKLFLEKLQICCEKCNFDDECVDVELKNNKTSSLLEILFFISNNQSHLNSAFTSTPIINPYSEKDYKKIINSNSYSKQISINTENTKNFNSNEEIIKFLIHSKLYQDLLRMIKSNLIRNVGQLDPKIALCGDIPLLYITNWQHISIIYDILIQFVNMIGTNDSILNLNDLFEFIPLFSSYDQNESEKVTQVFKAFISKRPEAKDQIFMKLSKYLYENAENVTNPFCFSPILNVLKSILSATKKGEISEMIRKSFYTYLISLACAKDLIYFNASLCDFYHWYIFHDENSASKIVTATVRNFSQTSLRKQSLKLNILNELMWSISEDKTDQQIIKKYFSAIVIMAKSLSIKISEESLSNLLSNKVDRFLESHFSLVYHVVIPTLNRMVQFHKNQSIKDTVKKVITKINRIDVNTAEKFSLMNAQNEGEEIQKKKNTWCTIAREAKKTDTNINLSAKLSEITKVYKNKWWNLFEENDSVPSKLPKQNKAQTRFKAIVQI